MNERRYLNRGKLSAVGVWFDEFEDLCIFILHEHDQVMLSRDKTFICLLCESNLVHKLREAYTVEPLIWFCRRLG